MKKLDNNKTKNKKKRLKQVFSNFDAVASLWASQSQDYARCRNGFFRGKSLYSYGTHYIVGRILELNGKPLAVINFTYWSRTTSGHSQSANLWARRNRLNTIAVYSNEISSNNLTDKSSDESIIEDIIKTIMKEKQNIIETFKIIGESSYCINYVKSFKKRIDSHNKFCSDYGLDEHKVFIPESLIKEAMGIAKAKEKARNNHRTRRQLVFGHKFGITYDNEYSLWCVRHMRTIQKRVC